MHIFTTTFCSFNNITSTVRAFCPGYFSHFASGLQPRHIGARPKGTSFGLGYHPGAIYPVLCLGYFITDAIYRVFFNAFCTFELVSEDEFQLKSSIRGHRTQLGISLNFFNIEILSEC